MEVNNILDGFSHLIFKDEESELLAKERMAICRECKYYKNKRCKICGCFISAKVRAKKSKCPKKLW